MTDEPEGRGNLSTIVFVLALLVIGGSVLYVRNNTDKRRNGKPASGGAAARAGSAGMRLRVVVNDRTDTHPVHPGAELRRSGLPSWFFANDLVAGTAENTFAPVSTEYRRKLLLHVDTDARGHPAFLSIPYRLTAGMASAEEPDPTVTIDIDDDRVTVRGEPVRVANYREELVFER